MTEAAYFIGVALAVLIALVIAFVYLTSRYRKAADVEKDKYIAALEARNQFLEEDRERSKQDKIELNERIARIEGQVRMLQDMVMHQCRYAEIDPATGGCRYCAKGLAYGQGGR